MTARTAGPFPSATARVLDDVGEERRRQNAKWGEQRHADGTGDQEHALRPLALAHGNYPDLSECTSGTLAYLAKHATDQAARDGHSTWTAILLEEVFEALAEDDPDRLRRELIQVSAVAVQWAEMLDGGAA